MTTPRVDTYRCSNWTFSSHVRFGSKADICSAEADVCFGPKADIPLLIRSPRRQWRRNSNSRHLKEAAIGGLRYKAVQRGRSYCPKLIMSVRVSAIFGDTIGAVVRM